jgi:hypothetical protein
MQPFSETPVKSDGPLKWKSNVYRVWNAGSGLEGRTCTAFAGIGSMKFEGRSSAGLEGRSVEFEGRGGIGIGIEGRGGVSVEFEGSVTSAAAFFV